MKLRLLLSIFFIVICAILNQSCRSTKFVPEGEYLLASATVKSDKKVMPFYEMETHIKQKPNFKTFSIFKLPLFLYNLSGKDSTKWVNRTLKNAGDPPVLYDSTKLNSTVVDLQRMMTNKGYLNARVTPIVRLNKKRAEIVYDIKAGEPYRISNYTINVSDSIVSNADSLIRLSQIQRKKAKGGYNPYVSIDTALYRGSLVRKNAIFDLDILDKERERITSIFRRTGYYRFNKEYVGFDADTISDTNKIDLDLSIYPFAQGGQGEYIITSPHKQYKVKSVDIYVDYNPLEDGNLSQYNESGVYERDGYRIKYGPRGNYIKPHIILNNCYIVPGSLYNESMTALTYSSLSQLHILKNVNIFWENDSTDLHCIITCVPDKKQGISVEGEGTNSDWYFGVGAGVGYSHRNAFKGSELFAIKLRGAYEAITPSFSSFNKNYFEIGGETSLTFPRFMFPLLEKDFRRSIHASTQFNLGYTYQRRPRSFTRTVLSSGVKYIWQDRRRSLNKHIFNLIDISYIHLPEGSLNPAFIENLSVAAQQYSFKDHFIMSMGYTFSRSNLSSVDKRGQSVYAFRASIETAGNALSLAAAISAAKKDEMGSKKIFGTNYAQYVRGMVDYSRSHQVDSKNSIAWRVGGGLAYPYGNNQEIPIQKRFFSGGANAVRGWAVRELGPGSYYFKSDPDKPKVEDNFYFHSGDIRFDANIEYRSKLFWIIETAAFIDAGNIWTVKEYEKQEGGKFKLDKFYKEVAVAWGLGLRLDFNYVLIRLDGGWKAYDPSGDPETTKWPIKYPFKFRQNFAWHIAVGYPF